MTSPSEQTILLTGASGFVAAHIIKAFLTAGYNIRGTVRSETSIAQVKATQRDLSSKLSFAIVPDITAPHAFDEAVKGVHGVLHVASPFVLNPKNNEEELLKPAIRGTENVLEAAARFGGPQLKKVIITSSFAAILDLDKGEWPGHVYTEKEWNPATYEQAAAHENGSWAYCASKALAERAAWDWVAKNNPSFAVTAMNPPWVFGPSLNTITSLDHLNESTEIFWNLINGSKTEVPPVDFAGFANATDLANAHLLAFENDAADGERFLVGAHFDYQSAVDVINETFPELEGRVPVGERGTGLKKDFYIPDGSKAEKVLGLKYTSLQDTVIATVKGLLEAEKRLGWVKK